MARRATIWDLRGTEVAEVAGDGSGGSLGVPEGLQLASAGFWVWYPGAVALVSRDGALLDVVERPPLDGATLQGVGEDRSFFAVNRLPPPTISLGWTTGNPVTATQGFRVSASGSDWQRVPVAVVDWSNYLLGVRTDDGNPSPTPFGFFQGQPFRDNDLVYFNPTAGNLGVVERNGAPGELWINEIGPRGDTIWRSRLSLPPVAQPAAAMETAIEDLAGTILSRRTVGQEPTAAERAAARQRAIDALHLPQHRPAAYQATFTASDELWLRSAETVDTLAVWYAVPHGDSERMRRVLLPLWFRLRDATATHVWGHRRASVQSGLVIGRALVPPSR